MEKQRLRQGTSQYIEETTGRAAAAGRDQLAAGEANTQEASDLDVPTGTTVLHGRNWLYDTDGGVIEYGESVSLQGRWASYDYQLTS